MGGWAKGTRESQKLAAKTGTSSAPASVMVPRVEKSWEGKGGKRQVLLSGGLKEAASLVLGLRRSCHSVLGVGFPYFARQSFPSLVFVSELAGKE